MRPALLVFSLLVALVAGCGDKVPQSEASRRVGEAPKQIIDKAADDTKRALQQGAERSQQAD